MWCVTEACNRLLPISVLPHLIRLARERTARTCRHRKHVYSHRPCGTGCLHCIWWMRLVAMRALAHTTISNIPQPCGAGCCHGIWRCINQRCTHLCAGKPLHASASLCRALSRTLRCVLRTHIKARIYARLSRARLICSI